MIVNGQTLLRDSREYLARLKRCPSNNSQKRSLIMTDKNKTCEGRLNPSTEQTSTQKRLEDWIASAK